MKIIFLIALLSFNAFSQTSKDIVKQLDDINHVSEKTKAPCPTCELGKISSEPSIVIPQEALSEINSGSLQFIGRDLFPGSDQNRTCVFKTDKAYVLYYNCMSSKKEAPATEIEVISFSGGITRYYVENLGASDKISKIPRTQYNGTFTVSYLPSPAPGSIGISGLKAYKGKYIEGQTGGGCWIGSVGKAQDMSQQASCHGNLKPIQSQYISDTESFWRDPGSEWIPTLQKLRKHVESAKY